MLRATKSELIRLKRPSFLIGGIGVMTVFGALSTFIAFSGAGTTGPGPAALFPSVGALAANDGFVAGLGLGSQLMGIVALSLWAIAVASDYRRRGVGSQMVAKLIAKLSSQRRTRIVLEVRETNLAAQLFFRENAFRAVSVLRAYYDDTPEDAYLMQYRYRAPADSATVIPVNRISRLAG